MTPSSAQPQQACSPFASVMAVAFPPGRTALYLHEVASIFLVTRQHVSDLITEQKLDAYDVSGGQDIAELLVKRLAQELRTKPVIVRQALVKARKEIGRTRKFWRVRKADLERFLTANHSRAV